METNAAKKILTIREASALYGFPEFGLRGLVKRGAFPVIRCGNRVYISRTVIEAYFERGGAAYDARHA